jgi:hypothetical protein
LYNKETDKDNNDDNDNIYISDKENIVTDKLTDYFNKKRADKKVRNT